MLTQTSGGFLIIGHRGAAGLAPENTLASFARAVELGVDGVEFDVRMAGPEAVVIHDAEVDRTTDGTGLVARMSLEELKRLDAGDGESIPTVDEVLEALPAGLMVNIELKEPGTAVAVSGFLGRPHETGPGTGRPRLLVSSFNHGELGRFHELRPGIACAPLAADWSDGLRETVEALDAWSVNLAVSAATPSRVATVHEWGTRCLVYTVNDPGQARQMREFGVDGVFTDYPDRVRGDGAAGR